MKHLISKKLKDLERKENIIILYACESGSRAWDFASPDSDWDCRFIYKRPLVKYVTLSPIRDVIEVPIKDKLDVNGWDIHKALSLAGKSNPALMEWLFSPIVYEENRSFVTKMRKYVQQYYSPRTIAYHYLHMAQSNYQKYIWGKRKIQRKMYFYVLRPLFCIKWLRECHTLPPTRFLDVFQGIPKTKKMEQTVYCLLQEKKAKKETERGPREPLLDHYINVAFKQFGRELEKFPTKKAEYELLNQILRKELFSLPRQSTEMSGKRLVLDRRWRRSV